jgi:hypothetical protein
MLERGRQQQQQQLYQWQQQHSRFQQAAMFKLRQRTCCEGASGVFATTAAQGMH